MRRGQEKIPSKSTALLALKMFNKIKILEKISRN